LGAVRARHDAIQNIEKTMIELAQLFQDLDAIVVQQEPMVQNIEQRGEEVHDNVVQGNQKIESAIEKARSRNRKKWWCVLIVCELYGRVFNLGLGLLLTTFEFSSLSLPSSSLSLSLNLGKLKSEGFPDVVRVSFSLIFLLIFCMLGTGKLVFLVKNQCTRQHLFLVYTVER
jgi:hypothetical protein